MVLDDTDKVQKVADLPRLHLRFSFGEGFYGEPYALNLNRELIQKIAKKDETECKIVSLETLGLRIRTFLVNNGYERTPELLGSGLLFIKDRVVIAGKNFLGFDKKFLDKLDIFNEKLKISHRSIDPAILFWRPEDKDLPSSQQCYERAGLKGEVAHTALDDAIGVVKLVRAGLKLQPLIEE